MRWLADECVAAALVDPAPRRRPRCVLRGGSRVGGDRRCRTWARARRRQASADGRQGFRGPRLPIENDRSRRRTAAPCGWRTTVQAGTSRGGHHPVRREPVRAILGGRRETVPVATPAQVYAAI